MIVFNYLGEIYVGYVFVLDCYIVYIVCKFSELIEKIDRRSGKKLEDNFKMVKLGDVVIIILEFFKLMCVESFNDYFFFGRFVVCDMK